MEERLSSIQSLSSLAEPPKADMLEPEPEIPDAEIQTSLPPGWRILGAKDGWKPVPMGVFLSTS